MLRSGREQAESLQRQHPKYRAFQDEMVASLTTFEQVEEWPDLIKCLGRVQKTLAKFSMVESLPSLVMLSKRLAQCLNPGLPSGVHMKALDTYAIVFVRLGKEKLTQNLGLFSAGLFPLLAYSSTRIRPQLLSLFEEFYVPLGTQLIPSLSGFILALLPGIEDPTSETYNRVLNLLESLKNCTGKPLFMLSLWRCLLLCPQSRLSGVQYISFIANQNQLSSLLPVKKSIAIEAIIATLYDGNVLAQRGMFEVLISHFPLSGIMTPKYTIEVLHGALPVLLRRESSVNRRFFSWLLTHPTEMTSDSTLVQVDPSNSESDSSTLLESTLDLVLNALLRMMDDVCQLVKSITQSSVLNYGDDNSPFDLKIIEKAVQPFDLVALLMERPEIKNSFFFERIVHALVSFAYQLYFLNISESISMIPNSPPIISAPTQESGSNIHLGLSQTIIQCAQSFLASQRIDRVWTSLIQILLEQFEGNTDYSMAKIVFPASSDSIIEALVLVDFSIDFLGIFSSNSETDKIGLSNIINIVLKGLFSLQWPPDRVSAFKCSLQFVLKMLQKLPDGANALDPQVRYDILRKFYFPSPALISLGDFYFSAKNEEHSFPAESGLKGNRIPLSILETLSHLFHLYETLLFSEIKSVSDKSSNHWVNSVELARVFSEISLQFSDAKDIDVSCIGLHSFLICVEKFEFLNLEPTCSRICRILWTFLDQKYSDSHYHICQLLYKLESLVPDACTDVISDALLSRHEKDRIEGFRRFSILWSTLGEITSFEDESLFSHGLMLMLDGLDDNRQSIRLVAQTWLLDSLSNSSNRVLDPLILHLLDSSTYKEPPRFEYLGMYDVRLVLYVLQKLISIITRDSKVFMESVIGKAVEGVVKAKWEKAERFLSYPRENVYDIDKIRLPEPEDYLSLLSFIAIRFIQGTPKANFPSEFVEQAIQVQSSSIEVLRTLISHVSLPARSQLLSSSAAEPIVSTLLHALNVEDSMMQVQLLGLLRFIVLEAHNGSSEVPALFSSSSFSSTILLGIQKAHEDFHKEHMGNSINLTQETLSLLSHWIWFTISILPVLQGALANVAISTITVICQEIRHIPPGKMYNSAHPLLLNGLRGVIHHCLFADEALSTSAMSESSENTASQSSVGRMFAPAQTISGLLFGGIFGGKSTTERSSIKKERLPIREAHTASLEMLPILVEACLFAWESFSSCIKNADDTSQLRTRASLFDLRSSRSQSLYRNGSLGISYTPRKESLSFTPSSALSLNHHVKKVKKEILHLLTPIAHNFPQPFMRAFLHSWEKSMSTTGSKLLPSHSVALELLNMLKTASPSVVIGSLVPIAISVMDNSDRMSHTSSENLRDSEPYLSALKIHETAALHLIDAYMKQCSFADQLHEALPHVLDLIKQSLLRSNHPLTFIWLLGILQQYVRRHTSVKLDKKSQKELQDITQQLLQTCAMFAGRSMPVRLASNETIPLPSVLTYIAPLQDFDEEDDFELPPLPDWLIKHSYHSVDLKVDSSMSLIAIRSLANVLVLIVDDVWEDKERACVVLGQVLTHLMPLLDSYGIADLLHKQAASVVLSTLAISKFQYSLKAWRKEAWGLFLKPDFFLTDLPCLQHWRFIVSRAVQSEFSLFSDLLSRSSGSQARLFQTQKAALVERARQLKRLSFIIHAGRLDQYARYLVQILELLVEGLKIPQATELHVQILLCIRVLLTRLSPEHLVAIWPVVLTEIIRAFEDASDLDLLLQACKFVDLALVLLPSQFQLYQWMFIADRAAQDEIEARHLTPNSENEFTSFIPHLLFLSRRVQRANPSSESNTSSQSHVRKSSVLVVPDDKTGRLMRRPVLTMRRISNAQELASFHDTVAEWVATESGTGSRSPPDIEFIDNLIICDFIEYGEEYKDPISSQFSFIRKVDIPGNLDDRKTGYIDEEDDSNSL